MFEDLRGKWLEYDRVHVTDPSSPQFHLSAEVDERLDQLDRLLLRLQTALAELDAAHKAAGVETTPSVARISGGDIHEAWAEVVMYTEAFYFFAWRLTEILTRVGDDALPQMRGVTFKGINRVRNMLIEHPEKKGSRRFARHFAVGRDGPVLKPLGPIAGEPGADPKVTGDDPGLFANARELNDKLTQHLVAICGPRQVELVDVPAE